MAVFKLRTVVRSPRSGNIYRPGTEATVIRETKQSVDSDRIMYLVKLGEEEVYITSDDIYE